MKHGYLLFAFLMLASCMENFQGGGGTDAPKMSGLGDYYDSPVTTAQKFACSTNKYAYFRVLSPTAARMSYNDVTYDLTRRESASGALFAGKGAEFWTRGVSAMLTVNGENASCNLVPRDSTELDPFPEES